MFYSNSDGEQEHVSNKALEHSKFKFLFQQMIRHNNRLGSQSC